MLLFVFSCSESFKFRCGFLTSQIHSHPILFQAFKSFEKTPFTYVDSVEALGSLASKLEAEEVIAIDLENHSLHSYQGFLCLMQISTRKEDFIVDSLALREEIGPALGHIFADPSKVKVMHGADSDIVWLQRDHGIYLANLFDTGQAARVLALPSYGLAHLLQHYCNYKTDKRHQMADWRVRPLPDYLVTYARADTHFLLYIYDRLKIDLKNCKTVPDNLKAELPPGHPRGSVGTVLHHSANICLQLYEKPAFTETSYLDYYAKQRVAFTSKQLAIFAGLYAWRDAKARELDESPEAVLAKSQLMDLSRCTKPESVRKEIDRVCNRKANAARSCKEELFRVIQSSVEQEISYGSPMKTKANTKAGKTPSKAGKHIHFEDTSDKRSEEQSRGKQVEEKTNAGSSQQLSSLKGSKVSSLLLKKGRGASKQAVKSILDSLELPFLKRGEESIGLAQGGDARPKIVENEVKVASSSEIREWADKKVKESLESVEEKSAVDAGKEKSKAATNGEGGLPQPLSKKYHIGKTRQQRPAKLDELSISQPTSSSFDYSAAREQLKNRKREKKKYNVFAQSFFSIPDENLVKPAKRRKQPQTGNRSMTFK